MQAQQQLMNASLLYQQRFSQVISSQEFTGVDEPSKRRFIGHFIYDYVTYVLRQSPGPRGFIDRSDLAPKVTGMLIELADFRQLLLTCQSLDTLALKIREALHLIQQATAETPQAQGQMMPPQ